MQILSNPISALNVRKSPDISASKKKSEPRNTVLH